ncbi:MAG: T9SS type A sorting domain-containing protein [Flavobacteriales bacterium]|nr:T9SS type A sorting domain-containing protein [Flavobacteriales bacterium]
MTILRISISIVLTVCSLGAYAQFTYFNHLNGVQGDDIVQRPTNVQVIDDRIFTWGLQNDGNGTMYTAKEFDLNGQLINETFLEFEDAFLYIGASESFVKVQDEDALIFCQTKVSTLGYQGILIKFNDQLDSVWTRLYDFMGPDTYFFTLTQSDTGFVIAGDNQFAPGQQGTFVAFLDSTGNYIDHVQVQEPSDGYHRNWNISVIPDGLVLSGNKGTAENTEGRIEFLDENGNLEWFELANDPSALQRSTMIHEATEDGQVLVAQSIAYEEWPYNSDPLLGYFKLSLKYVDFENETFTNITEYFTEHEWQNGGVSEILEAPEHSWVMGGSCNVPDNIPDSASVSPRSFIMNVDSMLDMQWYTELYYDTCVSCFNQLYDIAATSDGGYVGVGRFQDVWASDSNEKAWMVKIDACGDVEWQGCETVSGLWDIEQAGFESIHIWPNPVVDELNIESRTNQEWDEIQITDILGREVIRETIANSTVSVAEVGTGIYVLTLYSKGLPIHSQKFMKE